MNAGADYPPQPWRLEGALQGGVFVVPAHRLPTLASNDLTPITLLGRTLVCVVWARYDARSALAYNEALVAVLVRHPGGVAFTIPQIWVDSLRSAMGGRQLWAIPKEMGRFDPSAGRAQSLGLSVTGKPVMAFEGGPGIRLPGRWRLPLPLVQPDLSGLRRSGGRLRGRARLVKGRWRFSPDGALGWMTHATLIASGAFEPATLVFGKLGPQGPT